MAAGNTGNLGNTGSPSHLLLTETAVARIQSNKKKIGKREGASIERKRMRGVERMNKEK